MSEPRGCWAAHTALTVWEAMNLLSLAERALVRRGLSGEALVAAALLHDAGKLTVAYLKGKEQFHNVASALIALKLLSGRSDLGRLAGPIAQAVLLHHEHRMWEHLSTAKDYIIRDYYSILKRYNFFELDDRRAEALEALRSLVRAMAPPGSHLQSLLQDLADALSRTERVGATPQDQREVSRESYAPLSLPLYYLLQLADNRAAWRRSGVDWHERLCELAGASESPLELSSRILEEEGFRGRLLLTIPRLPPGEARGLLTEKLK